MCGIAGIFSYNDAANGVDRSELIAMADHMKRRGPDGSGIWIGDDGRIGLAHRRLAIIDLSDNGLQPMQTDDGRFVISFNGEIYNYKELRSSLRARGYRFRTESDTEVLLHLYADRGVEMVRDLRGMFAFALWDEATRIDPQMPMAYWGIALVLGPNYNLPGDAERGARAYKAILRAQALDGQHV